MHLKVLLFIFLCIPFCLISLEVQIRETIPDFLHSSKIRYEKVLNDSENSELVHFVMGNESADLDSIISSISYAYLLSRENTSELFVPLMNIRRGEIALRKDVLCLFQLFDISVDDLLFLDDNIPLNTLFDQNRLRLNLVDHNVLKPKQEYLAGAVERVVDHHIDENKHYPLILNDNKVITVVGSNATLIAEKLFSNQQVTMFPELAALLLAPILIDTSNLESAEKTTSRDIEAANKLQKFASNVLSQDFYEKLLNAKNDISGLTPALLLSKDFKEYFDCNILYGISSLPSTIQWNLESLELVGDNIQKYAHEKNLTFLVILMHTNEPHAKRKILIYSPSIDYLRAFDAYVKKNSRLKNVLIPDSYSENFHAFFYKTEKPIARKQLQPLFDFSFLHSYVK